MNCNYKELLAELNEELTEGTLTQNDHIQILRGETALMDNYYPIVDWYYDEYVMKEELETPLEEIYLPEEFSKEEWENLLKEQEEYKKQYESEKPKLKLMTVKDAMTEMKQIQKLFGR